MRHGKGIKKMGRPTDQRVALVRSLVRALVEHSKIQTTDLRAKQAKRLAERLITLGKDGSIAAGRNAIKALPDKQIVGKVFADIAPRYAERKGGYTRIMRLPRRISDGSPMAVIELI